jgi:DNA-binding CsgD family transcriptional regulator
LTLVPVDAWCFALIREDGGGLEAPTFAGLVASDDDVKSFLASELRKQRSQRTRGPKIGQSIVVLPPATAGVTMIFSDERTDRAIVVLQRKGDGAAFTSAEMLTLSSAVIASRDKPLERAKGRATPSLFILDREYEVVSSWISRDAGANVDERRKIARLPAILDKTARELTRGWDENVREPAVALPLPFLLVRAVPLQAARGPGPWIGLIVETFRTRDALRVAASRYGISPRELELVALLLEGAGTDEIAKALSIASSTVQDHIKRVLSKTGSRNRAELVSKILSD